VDASERGIEAEEGCASVMRRLASCRGAINGLLAEVVEDHLREHFMGRARSPTGVQTSDELIDLVRAYFKRKPGRAKSDDPTTNR
jgi:DNA-binding FrmR family transcriptional regulator